MVDSNGQASENARGKEIPSMTPIRNIGFFAHVDAGKTTLTEQVLLRTGVLRKLGSVDSGTAHTDDLPVERRRGISVRASVTRFQWKDCRIHLIDTPGHSDFSGEIERAMWALDGAVVLLSAVEGVQPQTEVILSVLRQQHLPILFFINKMDREGACPERVLDRLRRLGFPVVDHPDGPEMEEAVLERDDGLMEKYLEGAVFPHSLILERFNALARSGDVFPVLRGSALKGTGIEALLDAMIDCLPPPREEERLCAAAFAARQDSALGRGLWVRVFGGCLRSRMTVGASLPGAPAADASSGQNKITQIRDADGKDVGTLSCGEIGIVYGLSALKAGAILGDPSVIPGRIRPGMMKKPLLEVEVLPQEGTDSEELKRIFDILGYEDPLLEARFNRTLSRQQLKVMGRIQLEVLQEQLKERFGLNVSFGPPEVMYRETVAEEGIGFAAYTMPKPCWAILQFLIRPGKNGSGVRFRSLVPHAAIAESYQHQVEQALPIALRQGRLGWPVTDLEITLIDGSHHLIHTHPLDFIVATPWAIQDGLRNCGSVLLEPVMEVRFFLPTSLSGRIISDTAAMRGEVLESAADGEDRTVLLCRIPLKECMDYPQALASLSSGRAGMSMRLHDYRPCPLSLGRTRPRTGVDPLDTAKYILAARNALEGGIFETE